VHALSASRHGDAAGQRDDAAGGEPRGGFALVRDCWGRRRQRDQVSISGARANLGQRTIASRIATPLNRSERD
jgi:hypothetical protein